MSVLSPIPALVSDMRKIVKRLELDILDRDSYIDDLLATIVELDKDIASRESTIQKAGTAGKQVADLNQRLEEESRSKDKRIADLEKELAGCGRTIRRQDEELKQVADIAKDVVYNWKKEDYATRPEPELEPTYHAEQETNRYESDAPRELLSESGRYVGYSGGVTQGISGPSREIKLRSTVGRSVASSRLETRPRVRPSGISEPKGVALARAQRREDDTAIAAAPEEKKKKKPSIWTSH